MSYSACAGDYLGAAEGGNAWDDFKMQNPNFAVVLQILMIIIGLWLLMKVFKRMEGMSCDIIDEKHLANCLYYQQPYGKLGGGE